MNEDDHTTGIRIGAAVAIVVGGTLAVLGPFLRWTDLAVAGASSARRRRGDAAAGLPRILRQLSRLSQTGLDGVAGRAALGGAVVLLLAGLAIFMATDARWQRMAGTVGIAAGSVAAAFAISRLATNQGPVVQVLTQRGISIVNGPGIWLTILGGSVGLVGAAIAVLAGDPPTRRLAMSAATSPTQQFPAVARPDPGAPATG